MSTTTVTVVNDNYYNVRSNAGTPINLQYLDRDVARITQEIDLRLSHRLLLFSRERVSMSTTATCRASSRTNSVKFETVNGIEVGFTPLITGRFSFQFGEEHFWDNTIQSDPERIYRAELAGRRPQCQDQGRLCARFRRRQPRRSTRSAAGAPAPTSCSNTISRASCSFAPTSFTCMPTSRASARATGGSRIPTCYKASLGYEITRYWSWYLDYAYERRDAKVEINEFERQIIQTGIVTRF